jgi:hypothetical protein
MQNFDMNVSIKIITENLDNISQVTQQPIADIDIIVPTTKNPSHYLELVKALVFDISLIFSLE